MVFVSLWIDKGLGLIVGGFVPSPLGAVTSYVPTLPEVLIVLGIWALGIPDGDRVLQDRPVGSRGGGRIVTAATPGVVSAAPPRLVIAGLGGDAGKTLVALAIAASSRAHGRDVRAFKKGPDYIDAAWLTWASGRPARNLDTFLMGVPAVRQAFLTHTAGADLAVIEGNRGLFDGADANGTHSTAELAKALDAPVVLVVSATKVTRTLAACVLGCQAFDPGVRIAGVVLNRVAGSRHERIIRDSVENRCGVPVVGVLPRLAEESLLLSRHLGLVPPPEFAGLDDLRRRLVEDVGEHLGLLKILDMAARAPSPSGWTAPGWSPAAARPAAGGAGLRIGYLQDSAFTFYYPENLEQLEAAGAALVPISSLTAPALPPGLHALYIGGGFPETHAAAIAANRTFLDDLRRQADDGLPIYAECGGLMLLARAIGRETGSAAWPAFCPATWSCAPRRRATGTRSSSSTRRTRSSRRGWRSADTSSTTRGSSRDRRP